MCGLGEDLTLLLQLIDVGVEWRVHGQWLAGAEVQLGGLVGLGVLDLTTGELHRHASGMVSRASSRNFS